MMVKSSIMPRVGNATGDLMEAIYKTRE